MSSGFVSGGTADAPIERDEEWRQAQRAIEEKRKEKEDLGRQNEGKSLFEVLQANKEAFEQAARYKLHVTLDDDEADYLEGILEARRKEDASVKKETREQLEIFRRQQEEAERKALEDENSEVPKEDLVQWAAPGRKRKTGHENSLLKNVKLRKPSSTAAEKKPIVTADEQEKPANSLAAIAGEPTLTIPSPSKAPTTLALGLGYMSSDEDD
ncbi:N-terminal domain of NEFA-interacting nuclear protein NIP30-domain-containing protein [Boeremia exigua]|uniref:N-terminal domain of NEFA-interacting nuclear protein NIP30-domain-containing protein n=1 Tax=Boeremia exigua TaxID=749465 RepID=UPI001E8E02D4|nr:N-terminal domain of NEFA-interacting nuclear protein NIP30-domain-containing protein [Boeremia exigua]KAH6614902.1 N-terminal domain of NEFA-interacting nuclear protein NIP30-domain-containing protein [Boeremia exigua]